MHWCTVRTPALAEQLCLGDPPTEAVMLRADARDTYSQNGTWIIRRNHGKPRASAARRELRIWTFPIFRHLARPHQVPMRAPACSQVFQPWFLHQLSMRLETALLRVHRALRSRNYKGSPKGREGQDGQNRFLHGIISLQNELPHWPPPSSMRPGAAFIASIRTTEPIGYIRLSL